MITDHQNQLNQRTVLYVIINCLVFEMKFRKFFSTFDFSMIKTQNLKFCNETFFLKFYKIFGTTQSKL